MYVSSSSTRKRILIKSLLVVSFGKGKKKVGTYSRESKGKGKMGKSSKELSLVAYVVQYTRQILVEANLFHPSPKSST